VPPPGVIFLLIVAMTLIFLIVTMVHFAGPQTRYAKFRFGRFVALKGPGLVFALAPVESVIRVDLNQTLMSLDGRTYTTRDAQRIRVFGAISWRKLDSAALDSQGATHFGAVEGLVYKTLSEQVEKMSGDQLSEAPRTLEQELVIAIREPYADRGLDLVSCEVTGIQVL